MGTLFGTVLGYVLRGTTGSEGFDKVVGSARAVGSSREFQSLVQAAKSHAGFMIKDLSAALSKHADQVAEVLTGESEATASAAPADWEEWPPPPRGSRRPFPDDVKWPDG
jgi:hypothetical protein